MVNVNTFDEQTEAIVIEQVLAGKITELKIQGAIFAVKPDANVDPIKAAKDFLNAFDLKKTAMLRKVKGDVQKPKTESLEFKNKQEKARHTQKLQAKLEVVGRVNNIPIHKEYVTEFYRKYPETFIGKDLVNFMGTKFVGAATATLYNKQRAYIEFFRTNGWIEQIAGSGKSGRKYKFIAAPYNTEIIKPEFNVQELMQRRQLEMLTVRDQ